jgi:hypothetical protein
VITPATARTFVRRYCEDCELSFRDMFMKSQNTKQDIEWKIGGDDLNIESFLA